MSDHDDQQSDQPEGVRETAKIDGEFAAFTSFLESISLFEELTPEELREIYQATRTRRLDAGETLFNQGDAAESMFAVRDGSLEVRSSSPSGEDVVLAELESGTIVGEMSIIGGGRRSATVQAASQTHLLELSRQQFEQLRQNGRPVAYKIMMRLARLLERRRRQTESRIDEVFEDPGAHIEQFEDQVHDLIAQLRKV
jgi:CRP-like cAMP-binding protein